MTTVDLSGGAARTVTVELVLPDRPEVEWFALAVPIPLAELDDPAVTARQVALDAGMCARETVEQALHPLVLERRRDAR